MEQIFTYITIALLIGFVLYFGFNMVGKFKDFSDKGELKNFESNVNKEVSRVYGLDVGSTIEYSTLSKYRPLSPPNNILRICVEESKVIMKFKDRTESTFIIPELRGNECFNLVGGFSFVLENKILSRETIVEIKNVE